MKVRAVIFDVYGTLLDVGPPPNDARAQWRWLWESHLGCAPRLGIEAFDAACEAVVHREHSMARARGISFPEVYWPDVLLEVIPELARAAPRSRKAFEVGQARVKRSVALMPGAAPVIRLLMASGVAAGIASNAQPYTLAELDAALRAVGLGSDVFRADLSFWSFQNGFSKPDPHVFQALSARLRAAGALPEEVLMVGDRMDNDITPARRCGWQAFHLRAGDGAASSAGPGGDWHDLARWLDGKL